MLIVPQGGARLKIKAVVRKVIVLFIYIIVKVKTVALLNNLV